jgi:uncharacterized integral membrane protein (TIGR00697 family)
MRKKLSAWKDKASDRVASLKDSVQNKITNWVDGKTTLTTMFAGSVVSANILASKVATFDIPLYGDAHVPAGFLGLGAAFLFTDTLSELYGAESAHKAVNGTIMAVALSLGLVHAAVAMPSAPFYPLGQEYSAVLSAGTSISVASILSMLVSQNLDVSVFHNLRERGLPKWVRNIGSTVTSQLVDTALFITLAFAALPTLFGGDVTPMAAIPSLIVSQYLVKVGVAAADTPLFYLLTAGSDDE